MCALKSNFLKVKCRDCGSEATLFDRAATLIICKVCGSTLAEPAGGKARLVGCNLIEVLE